MRERHDRGSACLRARLVEQLNAISARWRGKNPERGFTMSWSQEVVGTRCLVSLQLNVEQTACLRHAFGV